MTKPFEGTDRSAGFSVVEVLVASAILLIVTVGLLPMFVRSINNNVQGQRLTELVHRSNSSLERIIQDDYNDQRFDVQPGDTFGTPPGPGTETIDLYSSEDQIWYPEADFPTDQVPEFRRAVRVRHLMIVQSDLDPDAVVLQPTDGGADVKEVQVAVTNADDTVFGPSRQLTLRFLKAF